MNLQLELNGKIVKDDAPLTLKGAKVLITPPINEDFWLARVKVSEHQAVVAFPKFFTIGIGFQKEDADWNTNLPASTKAEEIFRHIAENKGDDSIPDERCIEAIRMLQTWATDYRTGLRS